MAKRMMDKKLFCISSTLAHPRELTGEGINQIVSDCQMLSWTEMAKPAKPVSLWACIESALIGNAGPNGRLSCRWRSGRGGVEPFEEFVPIYISGHFSQNIQAVFKQPHFVCSPEMMCFCLWMEDFQEWIMRACRPRGWRNLRPLKTLKMFEECKMKHPCPLHLSNSLPTLGSCNLSSTGSSNGGGGADQFGLQPAQTDILGRVQLVFCTLFHVEVLMDNLTEMERRASVSMSSSGSSNASWVVFCKDSKMEVCAWSAGMDRETFWDRLEQPRLVFGWVLTVRRHLRHFDKTICWKSTSRSFKIAIYCKRSGESTGGSGSQAMHPRKRGKCESGSCIY